jgi:hypothetical protein
MRLRATSLCLFVLSVLAPMPTQAQEEEPPASYTELVNEALRESAAGRWAEARVLFRRAHDVYPNARTLRGIGMVAYELSDYTDAIRHLRLALDDARRPLTDEQRAEAQRILDAALGFVGRYTLENVPSGARFLIDGRPLEPEPDGTLLLDSGPHHVVVSTDEGRWEGRWRVRGGENEALPIVFEAPIVPHVPGPPTPMVTVFDPPPAAWAVTIAGASALVVGAVLLAFGLADMGVVQGAPSGTPWTDLRGAYERAPVLTGIGIGGLVIGGALGLVGGLWLGTSTTSVPAPSARLELGGAW